MADSHRTLAEVAPGQVLTVGDEIRVAVDHNRCVGSTMCVQVAGETFALNEERQSIVIDPSGASREQVLDAAEQCPQEAITVDDAATGENLYPGQ